MAGMIPGVGVDSRRRTFQHKRLEDSATYRKPSSTGQQLEPSMVTSATAVDMDETALRARRRLEQKLGYIPSSSRRQGGGGNQTGSARTKERRLGSKILRRPWNLNLNNSSKADREICAVCLENFGLDKQVVDLSCSHKYHSQCLLPWLASHPHCPYCRTPVQV